MRERLARRLLGEVMGWDQTELKLNQPIIEALAQLKFDEYQQFKPGLKFVESLAIWLSQFKTLEERRIAYKLVNEHLIFVSSSELMHLVDIAYPSVIRPILLKSVAEAQNIPYWAQGRIVETSEFKELRRRCLFLGLSDGARIDRFRRVNGLSNEQVHSSYELSAEKVQKLIKDLKTDIGKLRRVTPNEVKPDEATFKFIFFIDDFSGSGVSLIQKKDDSTITGKLARIHKSIFEVGAPFGNALDPKGCETYTIMYIMTQKAYKHTETLIEDLWKNRETKCKISSVLLLDENIRLKRGQASEFESIIENYYDPAVMDENLRVGQTEDVKYGFADVGLPLIINHNTPNDSLFILWGYDGCGFQGLFPRVPRHREDL